MREIKFRVWDNQYKYMNYKVMVGIYGEWEKVKNNKNYTACCMWIEPDKVDYKCEPHWAHFEPYHREIHLMQYTGIKDKKGNEIYEGDIIEFTQQGIKARGKVVYKKGCYFAIIDKKYDCWLAEGIKKFNGKIIGNIFDNPEMLEE